MNTELEKWRHELKWKVLRVSRTKTEYLTTKEVEGLVIRLQDPVRPVVNKFKCLGSVLERHL